MSDSTIHPANGDRAFRMSAVTFRDLVSGALVAASKEASLPSINSVLIEWDATSVTVAATDRYRLAVGTAEWPGKVSEISGTGAFLMERKVAADIVKSLPKAGKRDTYVPMIEFGATLGGDHALTYSNALTGEQWTRHVRSIDGQFPKWRTLMPTAEQLGKSHGLASFTCNADYMADVASLPHDKLPVTWQFRDSNVPALATYPVTDSGVKWQYLLMPVRLP